jgi:hypothetical protein
MIYKWIRLTIKSTRKSPYISVVEGRLETYEIDKWCSENFKWADYNLDMSGNIFFRNESDAVAFKLRWQSEQWSVVPYEEPEYNILMD